MRLASHNICIAKSAKIVLLAFYAGKGTTSYGKLSAVVIKEVINTVFAEVDASERGHCLENSISKLCFISSTGGQRKKTLSSPYMQNFNKISYKKVALKAAALTSTLFLNQTSLLTLKVLLEHLLIC